MNREGIYGKAGKGFYYVLWVLWLYKTQKWSFSQANDLLSKKEQNCKNFDIGQSLTKNADGWPKSQLLTTGVKFLARKSTVDKKVNGGRETQRLTPKS